MKRDEESKLSVQPDRSKLLMNESLRSVLGDSDPFQDAVESHIIIVALDRFIGGQRVDPITGSLVSFLLDKSPEIEVKLSVSESLNILRGMGDVNHIAEIQLRHGQDTVSLVGPYEIEAIRMQDVVLSSQTCVLAMKLVKHDT